MLVFSGRNFLSPKILKYVWGNIWGRILNYWRAPYLFLQCPTYDLCFVGVTIEHSYSGSIDFRTGYQMADEHEICQFYTGSYGAILCWRRGVRSEPLCKSICSPLLCNTIGGLRPPKPHCFPGGLRPPDLPP